MQRAHHYAELGHFGARDEALLESWRDEPCVELSQLIVDLPWPPDWQSLKQDAFAATDALSWVKPLSELGKRERDPRQTPLLVHLAGMVRLQQPAFRADLGARWRANGDPLARVGMEAVAHRLSVDPKEFWGVGQAQLEVAAPTAPEKVAVIAQLALPVPLHPVLRSVYDVPRDDGPRRVLSDLLLERGDPWGELIALQLQGDESPRTQDLIAQLSHRLGQALGDGVTLLGIERGFPVGARVDVTQALRPSAAWRTVQQVHFGESRAPWTGTWTGAGPGQPVLGHHRRDVRAAPQFAAGIAAFLNDSNLQGVERVAEAPLEALQSPGLKRVRFSALPPARLATLLEVSERMAQVEHWSLGQTELATAAVLLDRKISFDAGAVGRWRIETSSERVSLELITAQARDQWLETLRRREPDSRAIEIRAGKYGRVEEIELRWLRERFSSVVAE